VSRGITFVNVKVHRAVLEIERKYQEKREFQDDLWLNARMVNGCSHKKSFVLRTATVVSANKFQCFLNERLRSGRLNTVQPNFFRNDFISNQFSSETHFLA
jgi:hypothetical protein